MSKIKLKDASKELSDEVTQKALQLVQAQPSQRKYCVLTVFYNGQGKTVLDRDEQGQVRRSATIGWYSNPRDLELTSVPAKQNAINTGGWWATFEREE